MLGSKQNKFYIILLLASVCLYIGVFGCGQKYTPTPSATATPTASSSASPTAAPGYNIFNGQASAGQAFSFEYPETWLVSEETLDSTWNNGQSITIIGPGTFETGYPILSIWVVPKSGAFPDLDSYIASINTDRSVFGTSETGPGLISDIVSSEIISDLNLSAESRTIFYNTASKIGNVYNDGTIEVEEHYNGDLVSAESEWVVFRRGNYIYDINFLASGLNIPSREAFLHSKQTFKYN